MYKSEAVFLIYDIIGPTVGNLYRWHLLWGEGYSVVEGRWSSKCNVKTANPAKKEHIIPILVLMHFLSPLVHFWCISLTFFFVRFILIVVTWHYWYIAGNTATMLKYNEFDGEVSSGLACLAVDSHLYGWIKWFTQSVGVCVILLGRWSFFFIFV